ncbi:Inositol 1,4,5-trisphosphate receptor type 2 [Clarias magur]|uniref:Inositol 1,4,5-trisphosphate receptor type 2 n=1 Tax=Clarias magur TaxID=1594786 RepID=A0A8J4XB44_CLAMG|nr:Inositol 1,4,5-trisphosphate receptor type 2 [Clarias magur]
MSSTSCTLGGSTRGSTEEREVCEWEVLTRNQFEGRGRFLSVTRVSRCLSCFLSSVASPLYRAVLHWNGGLLVSKPAAFFDRAAPVLAIFGSGIGPRGETRVPSPLSFRHQITFPSFPSASVFISGALLQRGRRRSPVRDGCSR